LVGALPIRITPPHSVTFALPAESSGAIGDVAGLASRKVAVADVAGVQAPGQPPPGRNPGQLSLNPLASRSSATPLPSLSTASVVKMIGLFAVPSEISLPVRVTINAPGVPATPPGAARRGCPRTIVPGRIVSVAPLFTKIAASRQIGPGLATPPQVVFTLTSSSVVMPLLTPTTVPQLAAALAWTAKPATANTDRKGRSLRIGNCPIMVVWFRLVRGSGSRGACRARAAATRTIAPRDDHRAANP
jgi:hypothetical protein